jgi:hypothetical protein
MRKYYKLLSLYFLYLLKTQMGAVKVNLLREAKAIYTVKKTEQIISSSWQNILSISFYTRGKFVHM